MFLYLMSIEISSVLKRCNNPGPFVSEHFLLEAVSLHGPTDKVMMSASQCTALSLQMLSCLKDSLGEHISHINSHYLVSVPHHDQITITLPNLSTTANPQTVPQGKIMMLDI